MTPQLQAALLRASLGGLITGVLAALAVWTQASYSNAGIKPAVVAGVVALLSYVAVRGGVEGTMDGQRAAMGRVKPGDVQPMVPKV